MSVISHSKSLSDEENLKLFGKCNNPNGHGHNYKGKEFTSMLTHLVMDGGCSRVGWFECRITHGRPGPVMCLSSLVWLLAAGFGVF